ncbi:MAG: hypothetical protein R2764_01625 [Bacteroidales bacterium]
MNRLITDFPGKFPFYLDDFRWHEAAVRDAFKAIFSFCGQDRFIISGCEITTPSPGNRSCSEGYLYWDGEIVYCPGGIAAIDETNTPVFELHVYHDISGHKLFGSGLYYDTYQIRRAKFYSVSTVTSDHLTAITAKRLPELIAVEINNYEEDWIEPLLSGSWETDTIGAPVAVAYKKDMFGNLWLRGQAINGTGLLFTLPFTYWPAVDSYQVTVYPADSSITVISVKTDGKVSVVGSSTKTNLDGIIVKLN